MPVTDPAAHLSRDFKDLLAQGAPVGLAVSGGSDSVALLHLSAALGARVAVASLDHGLRAEAGEECAFVAAICADYNLPHDTLQWHWDGQGNLQDKARQARYQRLADWAMQRGIADIALGHTANDQAETVLMGLARGAGVDGLSGMAEVTEKHGLRFHRPLLRSSRAALRAYLTAQGHGWRDDPSNDDPKYERIRLRQAADILAGLGLTTQALARVADHMAAAAQALQARHDNLAAIAMRPQSGDMLLTLDLATLPQEQARRLMLAGMAYVNRGMAPPRREEQRHLLQRLRRGAGGTLAGCLLEFEGPVLRISREYAALHGHETPTTELWDNRWRIHGPHDAGLLIRALGDGIRQCDNWRAAALPHPSLRASPAIWRADRLICAPLAGFGNGWHAQIVAE